MPSILFFLGGKQNKTRLGRELTILDVVRNQTKYDIRILVDGIKDQKLVEDFGQNHSVVSLEGALRTVGSVDNHLLEEYSKKYVDSNLQRLRLLFLLKARIYSHGSKQVGRQLPVGYRACPSRLM